MAVNNPKSKLVEDQINKLLKAQSDEGEREPKYSPMVKKLLEKETQDKNVHKLKQMFEEKFTNPVVKEISYDDERYVKICGKISRDGH
jgi:phosphoribosylformylglycinamidine (FGAM) synthase PurS component